jgi:hypothetical protein
MQVTILAVQNSVERSLLGTATSSITFFRTIGSSLGGAIFGSILLSRLTYYLIHSLPAASAKQISTSSIAANGTSQIHHLPLAVQHDILEAFIHSFHYMFIIGIPFALAAFVVALFLREAPLRETSHSPSKGDEAPHHPSISA